MDEQTDVFVKGIGIRLTKAGKYGRRRKDVVRPSECRSARRWSRSELTARNW